MPTSGGCDHSSAHARVTSIHASLRMIATIAICNSQSFTALPVSSRAWRLTSDHRSCARRQARLNCRAPNVFIRTNPEIRQSPRLDDRVEMKTQSARTRAEENDFFDQRNLGQTIDSCIKLVRWADRQRCHYRQAQHGIGMAPRAVGVQVLTHAVHPIPDFVVKRIEIQMVNREPKQ